MKTVLAATFALLSISALNAQMTCQRIDLPVPLRAQSVAELLPDMVLSRAEEAAREFATLKQHAHAGTKLRTRADALAGIRAGIDGMAAEFEI